MLVFGGVQMFLSAPMVLWVTVLHARIYLWVKACAKVYLLILLFYSIAIQFSGNTFVKQAVVVTNGAFHFRTIVYFICGNICDTNWMHIDCRTCSVHICLGWMDPCNNYCRGWMYLKLAKNGEWTIGHFCSNLLYSFVFFFHHLCNDNSLHANCIDYYYAIYTAYFCQWHRLRWMLDICLIFYIIYIRFVNFYLFYKLNGMLIRSRNKFNIIFLWCELIELFIYIRDEALATVKQIKKKT